MSHPLFPADLDPQAPAFLNGRWLALSEAQVSVLDRGFLFGDGIYEVVPVYSRKPFAWAEHLGRLQRSLAELSLAQATADVDWDGIVRGLIERAPTDDQFIYLQVTRGVARRDHSFPRPAVPPTVFAMVSPLKRPAASDRDVGLKAVRMLDQRWLRCDIKSVALLGNVLAREAAVAQGAHEAILFRDGLLTEGAASNIWVVRQGQLLSPPRSNQLLAGIRMAILPRLAEAVGVPFESRAISEAEVVGADELLMSSATKEVLPITQLDGQAVGQGRPGPVFQALRAAYDDAIAAHRG
jgi:D-alanine transaminase